MQNNRKELIRVAPTKAAAHEGKIGTVAHLIRGFIDVPEDVGEETVGPVASYRVKNTIQLDHRSVLWVDHKQLGVDTQSTQIQQHQRSMRCCCNTEVVVMVAVRVMKLWVILSGWKKRVRRIKMIVTD